MDEPPRQSRADGGRRQRIGGGALLQLREHALRAILGSFLGLADQFVRGLARLRPQVVLEAGKIVRRAQPRQIVREAGARLDDVALQRVEVDLIG